MLGIPLIVWVAVGLFVVGVGALVLASFMPATGGELDPRVIYEAARRQQEWEHKHERNGQVRHD